MIRDWWAEYFWSATYKAKAAWHRGLWVGILIGVMGVSILSKVFA